MQPGDNVAAVLRERARRLRQIGTDNRTELSLELLDLARRFEAEADAIEAGQDTVRGLIATRS